MCVFLLATVIFAFAPPDHALVNSDLWWHLLNARNLLQNHSLSRVDTYSFTTAGSPWMNFEWLSEIPFFLAFDAFGWQGIMGLYFGIMVLIFAAVYYRTCRSGADYKDAAVATAAAICLGGLSRSPRTQLFGWLCMMILLLVIDHFRRTGRGLWILPPLFALWINLHGSWPFGLVVMALIIASGLIAGEYGNVVATRWTAVELRKLLFVLGLSIAALFVNPFGYKLVLYPVDFTLRQQRLAQVVEEWRPVEFGTFNGTLTLVLILVLLGFFLFSCSRWRLDEVLLAVFALASSLLHVRFLFFAALVLPPILAPRFSLFPPYDRELDKPWLNATIMALLVCAMVWLFPSRERLQRAVSDGSPGAALEFMQKEHLTGRLFNEYEWGGFIEWHAPDLKTFVDGRTDIFVYNGVFDDLLRILSLDRSLEILDKYRIEYVLYEPNLPLTYLLQHSPNWRQIYSDSSFILFRRVTRN